MSKKTTTTQLGKGLKNSKTNWDHLSKLKDEDIDCSDIAAIDASMFEKGEVVFPPGKKLTSLRLDVDLLQWFKGQGKGYQSRINAVLRAYYEVHGEKSPKP